MRTLLRRANLVKTKFFRDAEKTVNPEKIYHNGAHHYYYTHHHRHGGWFKKALLLGFFGWAGYHAFHHFGHHNHYCEPENGFSYNSHYFSNRRNEWKSFWLKKLQSMSVMKLQSELDQVIATKGENSKEAAMLNFMIGVTLSANQAYLEARNYLNRAISIGQRVGDESSHFVKTALEALEMINQQELKTNIVQNESYSLDQSIDKVKTIHGNNSQEAAQFYKVVGDTYVIAQDYSRAASSYKQSMKIFNQLEGEKSIEAMALGKNLANAYVKNGQPEKARKVLDEVYVKSVMINGQAHPETIQILKDIKSI